MTHTVRRRLKTSVPEVEERSGFFSHDALPRLPKQFRFDIVLTAIDSDISADNMMLSKLMEYLALDPVISSYKKYYSVKRSTHYTVDIEQLDEYHFKLKIEASSENNPSTCRLELFVAKNVYQRHETSSKRYSYIISVLEAFNSVSIPPWVLNR